MRPDFSALAIIGVVALTLLLGGVIAGVLLTRRSKATRGSAPDAPMNTIALIGFIAAFFAPYAAVPLGHVALVQLKRRAEGGWGLAIASLWIGYAGVWFSFTYVAVWLWFMIQIVTASPMPR